jgi:hypothetical protein
LARGLRLINSNSLIEDSTFNDSKVGILIEGSLDTSTVNNCLFDNNLEAGLQVIDGAMSTISNNKFLNNGRSYIDTRFHSQGSIIVQSAYPKFIDNQASNNLLNGILIDSGSFFNKDVVLQKGLPYVLLSHHKKWVTIGENTTLTINPGTIIKTHNPAYYVLSIKGTLKAEADIGNEIVITSLMDDSFGGDTNNDGNATIPASGDWTKIKFETTSTGSVFDNVFMYYGTGTPPIELVGSASVDIKDTVDYLP